MNGKNCFYCIRHYILKPIAQKRQEMISKFLKKVFSNKKPTKEKRFDKSEHRKYTTKYEDLCQ